MEGRLVSIRIKTDTERQLVRKHGNRFVLRPTYYGNYLIPVDRDGIPHVAEFIFVESDQIMEIRTYAEEQRKSA
jgi:hypothetical protein